VLDNCRLVERLRLGGRCNIYRAEDLSDGHEVICKVFARDTPREELDVFIEETRIVESIGHPALRIAARRFERVRDGRPLAAYVSMELAGVDLEHSTPPSLLVCFREVASALQAIHQAGHVHAAVDDSHVLVDGDKVRLIGFSGLRPRNQRVCVGPAPWIALELALDGGAPTPRSDVFALGVLMYEKLASRRLVDGEGVGERLVALMTVPIAPLPSTVPVPVADLVMAMLAKDPNARPTSAEIVTALR
jgi:serine/threonine-protein kinase